MTLLILSCSPLSFTSVLIAATFLLPCLPHISLSLFSSKHPYVLRPPFPSAPLRSLPPFAPDPLASLLFSPTRFATLLALKIFPRHGNAPPHRSLQCQRCRRRQRGCETTPDFTFPPIIFHLSALVWKRFCALVFYACICPFAGVRRVHVSVEPWHLLQRQGTRRGTERRPATTKEKERVGEGSEGHELMVPTSQLPVPSIVLPAELLSFHGGPDVAHSRVCCSPQLMPI